MREKLKKMRKAVVLKIFARQVNLCKAGNDAVEALITSKNNR